MLSRSISIHVCRSLTASPLADIAVARLASTHHPTVIILTYYLEGVMEPVDVYLTSGFVPPL